MIVSSGSNRGLVSLTDQVHSTCADDEMKKRKWRAIDLIRLDTQRERQRQWTVRKFSFFSCLTTGFVQYLCFRHSPRILLTPLDITPTESSLSRLRWLWMKNERRGFSHGLYSFFDQSREKTGLGQDHWNSTRKKRVQGSVVRLSYWAGLFADVLLCIVLDGAGGCQLWIFAGTVEYGT